MSKVLKRLVVTAAGAAAAIGATLTPGVAQADTFGQTPDPGLYCYNNPPFQTQVREAFWQVYSWGNYTGTIGENNMACEYQVVRVVSRGLTLPPTRTLIPIDWKLMCDQ